MNSIVPHPIPYQGSKRNLAERILSYAPRKISRLVEPFAGSAAISLAAGYRGMCKNFWLNDAHKPLVDLWSEIIHQPERLAAGYTKLWKAQLGNEREYFDVVRSEFNTNPRPAHFLYLLARCVKAAIRYNANGEFNNTPDNRRKGAKPQEMASRIIGASQILEESTEATSVDYRQVLAKCKASDLVYMDPPYQGVCQVRDHRYAPKVDHDEFCDALADLNKNDCRYIVSYDGRTGTKQFGKVLPPDLRLVHLEVCAGRSTQATLLGRSDITYESLYLSPALVEDIGYHNNKPKRQRMLA